MLKTIIASTRECDNAEDAIEEILSQLNLENPDTLKKNTVGIVSLYWDFVETGVYKAVCEKLPFDVLGSVNSTQSANGESDDVIFSITVLTSDDICFRTILTSSVLDGAEKAVSDAYIEGSKDGRPSLVFLYAPYLVSKNCGDTYVRAFNTVSGNGIVSPVPLFGTMSMANDYYHSVVLAGGEHYSEQAVMLFFYGDVKAKFYIGTVMGADPNDGQAAKKPHRASSSLFALSATVTASEENRLIEVNGRPVADYLSDLGMLELSKKMFAMVGLPFLVDLGDGTPPSLNYFSQYFEEEKYAVCGGDIHTGSTFSMYINDGDSIVEMSRRTLDRAVAENPDAELYLSYPCIGRELTLGSVNRSGEEKVLFDEIVSKTSANRIIAYSGGEICPVGKIGDNYANRFQGITFTLIVLSN